jgi:hypothetical protein
MTQLSQTVKFGERTATNRLSHGTRFKVTQARTTVALKIHSGQPKLQGTKVVP